MGLSLAHGKKLDVGEVGIQQDDLPQLDAGPVDLNRWFASDDAPKPLELEIGSGKGTFLVRQAAQSPQSNYIGIEYAKAFWRYASDRCRRRGLGNVRIVYIDAALFVRHYVPPASLHRVHVYFPDPWPKKRHHKRRLIQEPFLRGLWDKLQPNARVNLATDHHGYYQWMLEHAERVSSLYTLCPFEPPDSADSQELVGTNYERKYRLEDRAFFAMTLIRRDRESMG